MIQSHKKILKSAIYDLHDDIRADEKFSTHTQQLNYGKQINNIASIALSKIKRKKKQLNWNL